LNNFRKDLSAYVTFDRVATKYDYGGGKATLSIGEQQPTNKSGGISLRTKSGNSKSPGDSPPIGGYGNYNKY